MLQLAELPDKAHPILGIIVTILVCINVRHEIITYCLISDDVRVQVHIISLAAAALDLPVRAQVRVPTHLQLDPLVRRHGRRCPVQ